MGNPPRMDELDRQIITILEKDGRAANATIARKVGVSEGTVRRRLKRLIGDEIIKVKAFPDPKALGFESEALIGVQVDPDKMDQVATELSDLENTRWVALATGTFDIFAWAILPDAEKLGSFLREKVGVIPGVRRTETFVTLAIRKRDYGLPIA
jgi:Lrp/AsnC family transcriptional regulator for asnA, asnC and gidA